MKTEDRFDHAQGTLDLLIMPSETGREAKFYELTVKGRAHLKTENWKRLTDVVGLVLKGTLEGIS